MPNLDLIPDPTLQRNYRQQSVGSGATGDPIILYGRGKVSVALHPSGASAKVQFTLSPLGDIPGSANWVDWADGDVAASTADTLDGPVNAVRAVNGVGITSTFEVVQDTPN